MNGESTARSQADWLWPAGIIFSVVVVAASMALDVEGPFRALISVWFLAVCPGAAWVRLVRIEDQAARWTIAIAASLSVELLVALGMVYTGWWSVGWGFAIVATVAIVGAVWDLLRRDRARTPIEGTPL